LETLQKKFLAAGRLEFHVYGEPRDQIPGKLYEGQLLFAIDYS